KHWLYWLVVAFVVVLALYTGEAYSLWPSFAVIRFPHDTTSSVLTLQATLAALTYPIVLALVGVLLQRSWSDLRVRVYVAYSGALLAGASALLMIAIATLYINILQNIVSPFIDSVANVAILTWF